jgi:parallel beta-helix repeat protein
MNTKRILLLGICFLLVCASVGTASGKIWYVDGSGGADFTKIQDAINAANESDTIFVYNGTYIEHLSIDKNNLTILGDDRNTTIIDGYGYEGDVVTVEHCTTNCTINGFTIKNSGVSDAGIATKCSLYINISNNILKNNYNGLSSPGIICWCEGYEIRAGYNIIAQNIISDNNGDGISAGSSENIISHNEIFSNNGHGVSIYSDNNTISDNNVSYNGFSNIDLSGSKNNLIANNTIKHGSGGIKIRYAYYNNIINNTITLTYNGGIQITSSNHNSVIANFLNENNCPAIRLEEANYNLIHNNNISNNDQGINIGSSNNNLIYHNNLISNGFQAMDHDGSNKWDNGSIEGGNYWDDHNCNGNPSNGSQPYNIWSIGVDHYPFEDPNGWIQPENFTFDTDSGTHPSIFGTHNGTIKPNHDVIVNRMYTYPCPGTGGHSEYVKFENASWNITASWTGYEGGDWHNITFDSSFTLGAGKTYNYTIRTGSYPLIHHNTSLILPDGEITCTEFIDANRKKYDDWIPAIKLE